MAKTFSIALQGTSLVVTQIDGSKENIYPFSILSHNIELSKDADALTLQKGNFILTIPIAQIATYNTYALIKAQLITWIQGATITVDNVELSNVTIDGSTLAKDASVVGIGTTADAVASSDTGTFSLIALFKRMLTQMAVWIAIFQNRLVTATLNSASGAGSTLAVASGDINGIGVQILGTFVGTLVFEASMDNGVNWLSISLLPVGTGSQPIPTSSVTGTGNWETAGGVYTNFRVRMSAFTSGSANVVISATPGQRLVRMTTGVSIGGMIDAAIISTFTRMTNNTAYVANQVINNLTSGASNRALSNVARAVGSSGYLKLILMCANTSVTPRIRVHLYDAAPQTAKNDAATWALDYTNDASKYLGYVDMDAFNGGVASATTLLPYKANAASKDIYYELQTLDAFTPASGTSYTLKVIPDQNNV